MIWLTAATISMPMMPPWFCWFSWLEAVALPVHRVAPVFRSTSLALAVTMVALLSTI
ncbi:hypothetical protein D3C80_2175000 [compost metagenome]